MACSGSAAFTAPAWSEEWGRVHLRLPSPLLDWSLSPYVAAYFAFSEAANRIETKNGNGNDEVAFFGIESSPSFVREPEGNGVAERFIRTLKENLLWVRSFDTIEELRLALLEFKRTYNEQWMLEKYHYQSPAQVRRDFVGLDAAA